MGTLRHVFLGLFLTLFNTSIFADNTTTVQLGTPTTAPYAIGDYYNEEGLEGVVFAISDDGTSGTIVSLSEVKGVRRWAASVDAQRRYFGASNLSDGMENQRIIENFEEWQTHFPAFAVCAALGEGWYLPSVHELKEFLLSPKVYSAVNNTLQQLGAKPLPSNERWVDYWSSTEYDKQYASGEYCAWGINSHNGVTKDNGKSRYAAVRAVAKFPKSIQQPKPSNTTTAPYSVGDYYNDGTLRGVVCEVNEQGTHGKLISLGQHTQKLYWAVGEEQQKVIGATNQHDGRENMKVVCATDGWEQQYPAFAWCASLGEGWYLPAIDELAALYSDQSTIDLINATLYERLSPLLNALGTWNEYWSSTEVATIYTPDEEFEGEVTANAQAFYLYDAAAHSAAKGSDLCVRAMAWF